MPKGGGVYRVGKPYLVAGRTYVPEENGDYQAEGLASWYGADFHGRLTANGEVFDMESISAAHPTLPMPSYVRVTNLANRRSIIVRVNDRGPYHGDRVIDLSHKAATASRLPRATASRGCASSMSAAPRSKAPTTASCSRPCAMASRRRRRSSLASAKPSVGLAEPARPMRRAGSGAPGPAVQSRRAASPNGDRHDGGFALARA